MSNLLAKHGSVGAPARERALAWQLRDVLGMDPFQTLRSSVGFDYDVKRTETGYDVEMPVPGYNASQIEVSLKDDILTVVGKSEKRSFSRSFTIPEDVDTDAIAANVRDGILALALGRRAEAQPKKITVSAS